MGKIESLSPRGPQDPSKNKKSSLYFKAEESFNIPSEKIVMIDENALAQEGSRWRLRRMAAYNIYNPIISRSKDKRLKFAVSKIDPLLGETSAIRRDIGSIVSGRVQSTTSDYSLRHLALAGAAVDLQNETNKMKTLTEHAGLNYGVSEFLNLAAYEVAGSADVAFGGVSLRDFASQTKKNKLPLTSLLNYFVQGRSAATDLESNPELKNNDPLYAKEYPLLFTEKYIEASTITTALLNALPMAAPEGLRNKTREYRQIQQQYPKSAHATDELVKHVIDFSTRLEDTILDPSAEEFKAVSEAVWGYMKEPLSVSAPLFHSLTGGVRAGAQSLYRTMQERVHDKEHGQFYSNLSENLRDFVEEASDALGCLTGDDLEEISVPYQDTKAKPVPTLDDLHDTVVALGSRPPKGEFTLEPDQLDCGTIAKPQEVAMVFDTNTPMRFAVDLGYGNETEGFILTLEADVKKKIFDWNVLEAPSDPALKSYYESSLRVLRSSLAQIQEMKTKETPKKVEVARIAEPVIFQGKKEKIRPLPETEMLSKRQRRNAGREQRVDSGASTTQSNTEVKKTILLPEDVPIDEFVRGHKLTNHAKERVLEAIHAFNEEGVVGSLKRLRVDRHSAPKYRLRVTTADGGVRVVLRESQSEEGEQKFEIEKIVGRNHRGDNYMEK